MTSSKVDQLLSYTRERIPGSGIRRNGVIGEWRSCVDCGAPVVVFAGAGDQETEAVCGYCQEDRQFRSMEEDAE